MRASPGVVRVALFDASISRPVARSCVRTTVGFIVGALCVFVAPPASANGVSRVASNVWVTDGTVTDVASRDDVVYLAGAFTRIGPKTGPFTIVDRATGEPDRNVARITGGAVFDVAPDGSSGYFVAGSFTAVDGVPRHGLARLTSTGALDRAFVPPKATRVSSVTTAAGRVFATAEHQQWDGSSVSSLVALDISTGQRLSWTPAVALSFVFSVTSGPSGSVLVRANPAESGVGRRMYRLDASTGALVWTVDVTSSVFVDGNVAYGQASGAVIRLDLTTGATTQLATIAVCSFPCRGFLTPLTFAVVNGHLYMVGSLVTIGGISRNNSAALDLDTNAVLPWTAPSGTYGLWVDGNRLVCVGPQGVLSYLDPDNGTATPLGTHFLGGAPADVLFESSRLVTGGSFLGAGGVERNGLAAVVWPSGAPLDWAPNPGIRARKIALSDNRIFVSGPATSTSFEPQTIIELNESGMRTSWSASIDHLVFKLRVQGTRLYVGGTFSEVNGLSRTSLASFDISRTNPELETWAPIRSGVAGISDFFLLPGVMLVGGQFTAIGEPRLIAFDLVSGAEFPWNPTLTFGLSNFGPKNLFFDVSPDRLWVSGNFTAVNGQPRIFTAAFDLGGNLTSWTPPVPAAGELSLYGLEARVFEDRVYTTASYSLDAHTGARTDWVPEVEVRQTRGVWSGVPGRGVVQYGDDGFAFYERQALPPPVIGLSASAVGNNLSLSWNAVAGVTSYILEAGSAPSLADLAVIDLRSTTPAFSVDGPSGSFYLRVRAKNDGGIGPPSSDLRVVLGANACAAPPAAPLALSGSTSGNVVSLQWSAPASGPAPARYVIDASTTSGGTPFAQIDTGLTRSISGAAPPGTYFVRVRAENLCGSSQATDDIRLEVR